MVTVSKLTSHLELQAKVICGRTYSLYASTEGTLRDWCGYAPLALRPTHLNRLAFRWYLHGGSADFVSW